MPMLKNSRPYDALIPRGARRFDFATMSQMLGRAIVDFQGSNSPTNLSSDPCSFVIQDETDKFSDGTKAEADASDLADQRTKGQALPKRIKTSTPTIEEGLIWQAFKKTDQRRRWLPCPHCGELLILVWSKQFTVFELTGSEAEVKWDSGEEGRQEGETDLDFAQRTARFECPHCQGHIRDEHKTKMDRDGVWKPSAKAAKGKRGWHLSSLYVNTPETQIGKLVVKFLQAKDSLLGLQGFINGDLAEPYLNQDTSAERVEIVTPSNADSLTESAKFMTVDKQLLAPHFWFVVRDWNNNSRLVDFGPLDNWEDVRAKQVEHNIEDRHVGIDSGYTAEEVYEQCLQFGAVKRRRQDVPMWIGWTPIKGHDRKEQWRNPRTHMLQPYELSHAPSSGSKLKLPLLNFSNPHCKDLLDRLRKGKAPMTWEVNQRASDSPEYFRHLDGEYRKQVYDRSTNRTRWIWVKRSRQWPNHMFDCEVMQLPMAILHGKLTTEPASAPLSTNKK